MKEFIVKRTVYTQTSTISEMTLDGKHICSILEDKVRGLNEAKIFGKTAIPAGRYQITVDYSNAFGKDMPHVNNVPGFAGIRIHSGNDPADTEGCLIVGVYDPAHPDWVSGSRDVFAKVFPLIQELLKAGTLFVNIQNTKTV